MIRWIIFDWGNTVMRELPHYDGAMVDWPHVEAMPGIEQALQTLRPHYQLAIATNAQLSDADKVRGALHRLHLDLYFDVIITAIELGVQKPDPAFFEAVLQLCGCAPEEAVMVGDSYLKDVLGAWQAGLRTIWYNWDSTPPPETPLCADAEIRDLADLSAVLGTLE